MLETRAKVSTSIHAAAGTCMHAAVPPSIHAAAGTCIRAAGRPSIRAAVRPSILSSRLPLAPVAALALLALLASLAPFAGVPAAAQGAVPPGTPPPGSPAMAPSDAPAASTAPHPLQGPALLAALRQGGYVLYLRHSSTDQSQTDSDTTHLENCATQRNLTGGGRAEAEAVGKSIKALGIPIGQVLVSPYCRARETAKLAFGRGQVVNSLNPKPGADETANREIIGRELRRLLSQAPGQGTNDVLVAHSNNIAAGAQLSLAESEIAVFQPVANGFQLIGSIKPDQWSSFVEC
jgi:phosphohistidine phosphatase SixA